MKKVKVLTVYSFFNKKIYYVFPTFFCTNILYGNYFRNKFLSILIICFLHYIFDVIMINSSFLLRYLRKPSRQCQFRIGMNAKSLDHGFACVLLNKHKKIIKCINKLYILITFMQFT